MMDKMLISLQQLVIVRVVLKTNLQMTWFNKWLGENFIVLTEKQSYHWRQTKNTSVALVRFKNIFKWVKMRKKNRDFVALIYKISFTDEYSP